MALSPRSIEVLKMAADNGDQRAISALKKAGIKYTPKQLSQHAKNVLFDSGQAHRIPELSDLPNILSPHAVEVLLRSGQGARIPEDTDYTPTIDFWTENADTTTTIPNLDPNDDDDSEIDPRDIIDDDTPLPDPEADPEDDEFLKYIKYLNEIGNKIADTSVQAGYIPDFVAQKNELSQVEMLAIKCDSALLWNLASFPISQIIEILESLRNRLRVKLLLAQKGEQHGLLSKEKKKQKPRAKPRRRSKPGYKKSQRW